MLLFAASVLVYANTFQHDFVLDDDVVFLQNRFVQEGVSAIPEIITHGFLYGYNERNDQSYRPLVLINFAAEKSIFGNNPKALHRLNVLYYGILCCLLFAFLLQLFQEQKVQLLFWISLLFALHPIHTEVVANIKGRDEILHAIFLILSFRYAFLALDSNNDKKWYFSLLFFFLALLCKEMAVTYILLLPLTFWVFREIEFKQILRHLGKYIIVLIAYFLLRNAILDTITFGEKMKVINNGLTAATTYLDQLATTILIIGNYIKLLFYPHPLAWDYSYPHFPIVSFSNMKVLLITFGLIGAGVLSVIALQKKNKVAYGFLFFAITFSIVSNVFILIGSTLGERFLFFPSIGFCIFLVLGIDKLLDMGGLKNKKVALLTLFGLISIAYFAKTIDRNKDWSNNESLFISGAEATPNNTRAVSALATVYRERGEKSRNQQEQLRNYQLAIEYYKRSVELYYENSDSHYNLGVVYMNTNQNQLAKESFEVTIGIDSIYVNAINNLGVIYFRESNYFEAEKLFLKCLSIYPEMYNSIANLGAVYHNLGDRQKAEFYYRKALELNPQDQNTRNNLNKLLN